LSRRHAVLGFVLLSLWPPLARSADLEEIRARKTLRVLVWSGGASELFAKNPGEPPGFEREILDGFAAVERLGIEVVPHASLDEVVSALAAGKGDMIAGGLVATEARRKLIDFTTEIFPIRHVVVTHRPRPVVTSVEALRREPRVGSIRGSSWAEELAALQMPPERIEDSFKTAADVVAGLKSGSITATVMSVRTAMMERRRDASLELGVFVGKPSSGCYGVRKDEPRLQAALSRYIDNFRRTPTWNRLVVKYFGDDAVEVLKRSRQP
jgi:peptidoglycan lytic transglycosylase F